MRTYGCHAQGVELVATVESIRILDEGTGAGAAVARSLDHADAAVDLKGLRTQAAEPLEIRLTTTEHPPWVRVEGPGEGQVTHDKLDLPDHVLSLLTRNRLDSATDAGWLHAAAVEVGGTAVVLVGESGTGKSTITAHLLDAGAALVTDEQLCVHPDHDVVSAGTRPVVIKPGGSGVLPPGLAPVGSADDTAHLMLRSADLGCGHTVVAQPALVVILKRDEASAVGVTALDPVVALELLCAHNLDLSRSPREAMEALTWLAATVGAVRLTYPDSAAGAAEVLRLLRESEAPTAAAWRVEGPTSVPELGPGDGTGARPAGGVVTSWVGEEAVLYRSESSQVVRLNEAGSRMWAALPLSGDELTTELRLFIDELRAAGVVERNLP